MQAVAALTLHASRQHATAERTALLDVDVRLLELRAVSLVVRVPLTERTGSSRTPTTAESRPVLDFYSIFATVNTSVPVG